ncbi:hypothetical protein RYB01_03420 [Pseudomonas syringae]|nr:hypothetical protein [Pseudomonas syringae]
MNTYNENLQATVNNTLAALLTEQTRLKSEQVAKDYSLYYAQEAQINRQDAAREMKELQQLGRAINDQSLLDENIISNLYLSATLANTDVAASNTNMATAASNVNIAANAISALAASIGSALNNAIASAYESEIYRQVLQANDFINETANDAREISLLAMEASSNTSEIVTQALLLQTTDVKGKVDGLLKTTQAFFDTASAQASAGTAAAIQAVQMERQAEGAVRDIDSQVKAGNEAYRRTNDQLNMGLDVRVYGSQEIGVAFHGLPALVPKFNARPASEIVIPPAEPVYYLLLVSQDQSATFAIDQAQQLFASRTDDQFREVKANGGKYTPVDLKKDVFGEKVLPGTSYVAYLYIELSMKYRRYIGDFSDVISSPSMPFTPATTLPLAQPSEGEALTPGTDGVLYLLNFNLPGLKPEISGLDSYCILVEHGHVHNLELLTSAEYRKARIYFNLDIAQQIAPANREIAHLVSTGKPGKKKAAEVATDDESAPAIASEGAVRHYAAYITATTTDNFGNPLKLKTAYKPYILTQVDSAQNEYSDAYVSVLSDKLDLVTFSHLGNPSAD